MFFPKPDFLRRIHALCAEKALIRYTAGIAIHSGLTVIIPFLSGRLIDSIVYGGKTGFLFLTLTGTAFAAWGLALHLRKQIIRIARNREMQIQCRLLETLRKMKPSAAADYKNGELAMKFYRDAGIVSQFLSGIYPQFLHLLFGFIFASGMVFWKRPGFALLLLLFLPVMTGGIFFYAEKLTAAAHAVRAMYDRSMNGIFEFMHLFPYLKAIAAEEPYLAAPEAKFRRYREINTLSDRTAMGLEFFNRLFLLTGEYAVLGIAGWMAWKRWIPIGDMVMFQMLFLSVLNSFSGLFQLLPGWKSTGESLCSLEELLQNSGTEDTECHPPIPTALADISVKDLSFQYPDSPGKVLSEFSCRIKAGTAVALTGCNGSGKTTLLKLLTGYLLPTEGTVQIAGRDLREWQIRSFRQRIACVFQDSLLICGTIRDNITLKNPRYTEADVAESLRLSGAGDLISGMPEGLDHPIGPEGGGLSGGERQKIAIARALIRKPELLVFDEVTNHLDHPSRIRVRELLRSLHGRATVLLVSHDPEIIQLCDQEIRL